VDAGCLPLLLVICRHVTGSRTGDFRRAGAGAGDTFGRGIAADPDAEQAVDALATDETPRDAVVRPPPAAAATFHRPAVDPRAERELQVAPRSVASPAHDLAARLELSSQPVFGMPLR